MIRDAQASDIADIVEMGRRFALASGTADLVGWDVKSAAEYAGFLINHPDGVLLLGDRSMIGGMVFGHPFNNQCRVFLESFWWSEARGGLRLLDAAEAKARELGAVRMLMLSLDAMPSLDGLYRKRGFRPLEKTFVKEL